ncbi:TPA: preprotein translocase subunit Sec61beta [Candidatus Woesearchaeota archaeon]|nr:preprotein translocase subunit Sec61beta [Candidatus Woesearchaeota archaeon]
MAQDKVSMPSGMGGLVRYFEEYHSKIRLKPGHVIVLSVVIIVIMLVLYSYGGRLLGI